MGSAGAIGGNVDTSGDAAGASWRRGETNGTGATALAAPPAVTGVGLGTPGPTGTIGLDPAGACPWPLVPP